MAERPEHDAEQESKRILERLHSQEGNLLGSTAQRLENHINAADAPQDDRIEVWGTRIGRLIGLAITVVAILWAVVWFFSN